MVILLILRMGIQVEVVISWYVVGMLGRTIVVVGRVVGGTVACWFLLVRIWEEGESFWEGYDGVCT